MKKSILVVDDNAVNLATLEKELSDLYTIIPVISGRRAIKYLYCNKVDMVLLDVQMPVMDGIQTLREIRNQKNGLTVPVIFLTARKDRRTVIEGSKLGIMDYITKPFDVKTLVQRIDNVFKRIGELPYEDEDLYRQLDGILLAIQQGLIKQAIVSSNEIIQYSVDDEISGRMMNARNKLDSGDIEEAVNAIKRIQRILEIHMGIPIDEEKQSIPDQDVANQIIDVIVSISNFKTQEAIEKCIKLRACQLPDDIQMLLAQAIDSLKEYDDEHAEDILWEIKNRIERKKIAEIEQRSKTESGSNWVEGEGIEE
jgi:DNA-binding response OmpR family regulator